MCKNEVTSFIKQTFTSKITHNLVTLENSEFTGYKGIESKQRKVIYSDKEYFQNTDS